MVNKLLNLSCKYYNGKVSSCFKPINGFEREISIDIDDIFKISKGGFRPVENCGVTG